MRRFSDDRKNGFTLIELVAVITIMAILVGIISPMFIKYVERSREAADVNNAMAAYSAATAYFMSCDEHVPLRLYYTGSDVSESADGIRGYGKSKESFTAFIPDDFPIRNVDGAPYGVDANYIILTMGPLGVEGLGWGVEVPAKHWDGTPKYTNRIFNSTEWSEASDADKIVRDTELLNSLELAAGDMTYGELIEIAYKLRLVEKKDGNICIRVATSNIDADGNIINTETGSNEIFANRLFRLAGFNTELPDNEKYIVSSRYGEQAEVWIDLGYSYEKIAGNTDLYNSRATGVVVYVEGGGTQLDDGMFDHEARTERKKEKTPE